MTKRMIPNVRRGGSSDCITATDTTTATTFDRMVRRWEGWMLQDLVHWTYRYATLCMTVRIIIIIMIHCILRTINSNSVFRMILIHRHHRRRRRWW